MGAVPPDIDLQTAKSEFRRFIAANTNLLASTALFSAFVNILMLTGPLYMLQLYDRVLSSRSESTLIALTGITAFLFLMMGLLDHSRGRVLARVGARYQSSYDTRVLNASLGQVEFVPEARTSPAVGLKDLETVRRFISGQGPIVVFDVPWTPFFLAILFIFHWLLGVQAVISGLLIVAIALMNQLRTKRLQEKAVECSGSVQQFAEQLRTGIETIQGLGMRRVMLDRTMNLRNRALELAIAAADRGGAFSVSSKTMRLFLQSLMLGTGGWLAIRNEITPGAMIAGSILLGRALAPLDLAIAQWPALQEANKARKSLSQLFAMMPEKPPLMPLPKPPVLLITQNLTIVPPGGDKPTVFNVNIQVSAGEALGITGRSGSGKSTLARALVNVWSPAGGNVSLGNASLNQYDQETLARYIGWLPQDIVLFDGTIAENIARMTIIDADMEFIERTQIERHGHGSNLLPMLAHDGTDNQRDQIQFGIAPKVVEAARITGFHESILQFPQGYGFRVGIGGSRLSGGQRQRIALARAFFDNPLIVVLDEPDAHLDEMGTIALNNALKALKERGGAAVVMAHRRNTFAQCDLVLVMERGQLVGDVHSRSKSPPSDGR